MNRLVLIDGNAMLHRAFHALPPLTSPDGTIVNAVYGFTAMLLRLVHELKPTHVAVAFDRPAPTFRKELFKDYQATRPEMDEGLVPQIGILHTLLEAFGVAIYEKDGFEADDVIGTIVKMTDDRKQMADGSIDQIIIVTGDRDIFQLVRDEHVFVYMPVKGLTEAKLYGEKEVFERLGVPPKRIVDYKALAGDSSDNYPGVAGIGPKTAVDLINKFQSIEALYKTFEDNEEISDGVKAKLRAGRDAAQLSKTLATIRTDVPIDIHWEAVALQNLATQEAKDMLGELHFHSLIKRIEQPETVQQSKEKKEKKKDKKSVSEDSQPTLF